MKDKNMEILVFFLNLIVLANGLTPEYQSILLSNNHPLRLIVR